MTDRYRGIAGLPLLEHKIGNRFSHNITSSKHHCFSATRFHSAAFEKFEDAVRGAWQKTLFTQHHLADIYRMESVHILIRVYGIQDLGFIDMLRQRQLYQYSVQLFVFITFIHQGQ